VASVLLLISRDRRELSVGGKREEGKEYGRHRTRVIGLGSGNTHFLLNVGVVREGARVECQAASEPLTRRLDDEHDGVSVGE
jgi:hypothetical protein